MKRLLFSLLLVGLLAGLALAQCGPGGCPAPGMQDPQCGPEGCQIPGMGPQYPGQSPQMMPPERRPLVPIAPAAIPDSVKQCHDSIVRIQCGPWGGSGTYLGSKLVVTCEHVARNGQQQGITVVFPDGQSLPAQLLGSDYASDLALLELAGTVPATATGIPVEEQPAKVGQPVFSAGYGSDRALDISPGRVLGLDQFTIAYDPTTRTRRQRSTAEASGETMSGDSGGAWLTEDGQLLGVVWGGRPDGTVSATANGLCEFLRSVCQRLRRPFPRPDKREPSIPPPLPAPVVDLGPLNDRLDGINKRLSDLENPPVDANPSKPQPDKTLMGWLAALAGGIAGCFLFYKTKSV